MRLKAGGQGRQGSRHKLAWGRSRQTSSAKLEEWLRASLTPRWQRLPIQGALRKKPGFFREAGLLNRFFAQIPEREGYLPALISTSLAVAVPVQPSLMPKRLPSSSLW